MLGPFVTVNFNIRLGPAVSPFLNVGIEQVVEALGVELPQFDRCFSMAS